MATIELSGKVTNDAGVDQNALAVALYTATNWEADGSATASTTTDSDGLWNFDAQAEGDWIVVVTLTGGTRKILYDGRNEVEFQNVHVTTAVQVDTINEATSGAGVTVDGMLFQDGISALQFVPAGQGSTARTVLVTMFKDTSGKPDRLVRVNLLSSTTVMVTEYKRLGNAWVFDPDDCAFDASVTLNFNSLSTGRNTAFAIDSPVSSGNRVLFIAGNDFTNTPDTFEMDSIVLTPGASSLTAVAVVIAGSNQPTDTDGMGTCSIPLSTTKVMTIFEDDAHFADVTESGGTYTFTYTDAKVLAIDTAIVCSGVTALNYSGIVVGSQVVLLDATQTFGSAMWEMTTVAVLTQAWNPFQVGLMSLEVNAAPTLLDAITAMAGRFGIASAVLDKSSDSDHGYIISTFPLDSI